MPLYNVKYSDITTPVLNYMLNNCQNLDGRFDSIPLCFKEGYSITVNQSHTWSKKSKNFKGCQYTPIYRYTIQGKVIKKYTAAQVRQDFTSKFNTSDAIVPNHQFYELLINLINYASSRMAIFSSQFSQNTNYLAYVMENTVTHPMDDPHPPLVTATTTEDLLTYLTQMLNSNVYNVVCQYKYEYISDRAF